MEFSAAAAIKFLKEGENGTNNSNYSAVILYNGAEYGEKINGIERKFQVIYDNNSQGWYCPVLDEKEYVDLKPIALTSNSSEIVDLKIYRAGQEYADRSGVRVVWTFFDADQNKPCLLFSDGGEQGATSKEIKFEGEEENITDKNISCMIGPNTDFQWEEDDKPVISVNILQAKIEITTSEEKTELYAYYPIDIIKVDSIEDLKRLYTSEDNSVNVINYAIPMCSGGFSHVLYASDGTNPQYDSSNPFTCIDSIYGNKYDTYNWSSSKNLKLVKEEENFSTIRPVSKYDSSETKNYVQAELGLNEKEIENYQVTMENLKKEYEELLKDIENLESNKENLDEFFINFFENEEDNFIKSLENENSKEYLKYKAKIYNKLIELEKQYNLFKEYYDDEKLIFKEGKKEELDTKLVPIEFTVEKTNIRTDNIEWNTNYNPFEIKKVEDLNDYLSNKNQRKNLFNLIQNYNNAYNKYKKIIVDEYLPAEVHSNNELLDAYNKFKDFYKDTFIGVIDEDGKIIEETKLSLLPTLYAALKGIYNKITVNSEECPLTYNDVLNNIVNETLELLSKYGSKDGLHEAEEKNLEQLKEQKQKDAAAALEEYNKLLIEYNEKEYSITYIRPVVMTYNRYELSAIAGWDGNRLYTGEGNTGEYLYAPQVGAGRKDGNGAFTGIVIGNKNTDGKEKIGLFGYGNGEETIFLNAEDGSSTFGKSGAGQIIIDPSQNKAILKSGNYNISEKTGMQIDLTTPEIRFGSGNFVVNSDGHITAKGGGSIGGWQIEDTVLKSGNLILDAKNKKIYSDEHSTLSSIEKGFYLGPDGLSIGKTINIDSTENGSIKIGRLSNESKKYWTINGDGINSYIKYGTKDTNSSVYIGTDKISLGTNFSVDNQGALESKSGSIGGWIIGENTLKSEDEKLTLNASGSISSGNWNINSDGTATFSKVTITSTSNDANEISTIGGIDILYGNINNTGGGGLSAGYNAETGEGWQILPNGKANFNQITAKGKIDATSGSLKNLDIEGELRLTGQNGKITCDGGGQISFDGAGLRLLHGERITITAKTIYLQNNNNININNGIEIINSAGSGGGSVTLDYATVVALKGLLTQQTTE